MEKLKILKFCTDYNKLATDSLKERFIKEKLAVKEYLPFLTKDMITTRIVDAALYERENYTDENGETKRRKTGNIKANSVVEYLLFCRVVIENYTNLESETDGFFEEYDVLTQTGLMSKIMKMIPESEINELNTIRDMKRNDVIFNHSTPHAFVSSQVERFGRLAGTTLKPILDKISNELENMDDVKVEKIIKAMDKGLKRIK